jgi:hypothetical protein
MISNLFLFQNFEQNCRHNGTVLEFSTLLERSSEKYLYCVKVV